MTRKDFVNCTALIAKRAASWTQEMIVYGDMSEDVRNDAANRFIVDIETYLKEIEIGIGISSSQVR